MDNVKVAADEYLDRFNIMSLLQDLLQSLLKEMPEDPYNFIAKQFGQERPEKPARDHEFPRSPLTRRLPHAARRRRVTERQGAARLYMSCQHTKAYQELQA